MDPKDQEIIKKKEELWTNRIIRIILWTCLGVVLGLILGAGFYVYSSLGPVDKNSTTPQKVTVPIGSSNNDVAAVLEESGIVKDRNVLRIYMKLDNVSDLQAGHYEFNKGMSVKEVIAQLEKGGTPISLEVDTKITVTEGMQLEQIAQVVEEQTEFTAKEFMDTVNNTIFVDNLVNKYSGLLQAIPYNEALKYPLEGYLYPKTYDYVENMSLQQLITEMVAQTNYEYQSLSEDLENTDLTFHEVLTLASIVEKEGVSEEDRKKIAGVFFNRLALGMPLQSDITALYALGVHKEFVTYEDVEVDSPYNLYIYTGLGPGPFNSPGMESIQAVLHPDENDYLYFVADLDTQKVYYADNYEDHEELVEKYVNSRSYSELDEILESDEAEH